MSLKENMELQKKVRLGTRGKKKLVRNVSVKQNTQTYSIATLKCTAVCSKETPLDS
jgi:hypothetical protein